MCKKLCLAVGAVIVGLAVVYFTGLSSLVQVKWNDMQGWMKKQVPPETQLKQLRVEIDKIDKDIKKNLGKLAKEEVEADRLEASITQAKADQVKLKAEIVSMTKALESKETKVKWDNREYRQTELALKLDNAVTTYELRKNDIKQKEQLLASKQQALDLAHQRISEMKAQKDQLNQLAEKLALRIEQVKLRQVDTPFEIDDNQVSKCVGMADALGKQLDEEDAKARLYDRYGYRDEKTKVPEIKTKSKDEILKAAQKALEDDEAKVVSDK